MAFYELVLTMCLMSDPSLCREQSLTVEAENLVEDCRVYASRKVEAVAAEEAEWRIATWRCEYPEMLSSLREPEDIDSERPAVEATDIRDTDPPDESDADRPSFAPENEVIEEDALARDDAADPEPSVDGDQADGAAVVAVEHDLRAEAGLDPGIVAGHAPDTVVPAP